LGGVTKHVACHCRTLLISFAFLIPGSTRTAQSVRFSDADFAKAEVLTVQAASTLSFRPIREM